jgi:Ca2+-binding RTX toxin-like protein
VLRFDGVIQTGFGWADFSISDLEVYSLDAGVFVYGSSGINGGLSVYELHSGALASSYDQRVFSSSIINRVGNEISPVIMNGEVHLVLGVDNAAGLVSYGIDSDGGIGSPEETSGLGGSTALTSAVTLASGALAIAHENGAISTYTVQTGGALSFENSFSASVLDMQNLQIEGQEFLVTLEEGSALGLYAVDAASHVISAEDQLTQGAGVGISSPTAMEVVQAYGASWVIVAGSASHSLSVMRVDSTEGLVPVDHILDTLHTRFGSVQDIAAVTVNGRVFIVAGGGDDGLSLLTLAPDGRLIYLDSFEDTLQTGLQNVEAIAASYIGDELQIFASSQEDQGLTQMSVSLSNIGQVIQGAGDLSGTSGDDMIVAGDGVTALDGGAGDDILMSGEGAATLTGGLGADVFVMRAGSDATTITDFMAGTDSLDLTDYALLRNTGQLMVTSTGTGADVTYYDEVVHLRSAGGGSLSSYDIFGAEFTGIDRAFFSETSNGNGDGGGGGSGGGGTTVPGAIDVQSGSANAILADALLHFTPLGGSVQSVQADATGNFDFGLASGSSGQIEIERARQASDPTVNAVDALEALRMAVGLDPTFGPAAPENFIAADINQDGRVTALDVLEILRFAVGLETLHEPEWVFLDTATDMSAQSRSSVTYNTVLDGEAPDGDLEFATMTILLGNIEML